jgi:hypothetical protein
VFKIVWNVDVGNDNVDDDDVDDDDVNDVINNDDTNKKFKEKTKNKSEMARNVIKTSNFLGSVGPEFRVLVCADTLARTPLGVHQYYCLLFC